MNRIRCIATIVCVAIMLVTATAYGDEGDSGNISLTANTRIVADSIQIISWFPDGEGLAYLHNQVMIIDFARDETMMLPDIGVIAAIAWRPDGQQLAVIGNRSSLWDVDGEVFMRINIPSNSWFFGSGQVSWNASGTRIALYGWELEDQTVKLKVFDFQTGVAIDVVERVETNTTGVMWHSTEDRLLYWDRNEFEVWDISDTGAEQIQTFEIPELSIQFDAATWSDDNRFIVASGRDYADIYLVVWDIESEQVRYQSSDVETAVTSVDWHPTQDIVATGHTDGTIHLWSIRDGIQQEGNYLCSQESEIPMISTVVWNFDGSQLACGSVDGTLIVWDSNEQ